MTHPVILSPPETERILGLHFFCGKVHEAIELACTKQGTVMIEASPALTKLRYDEKFRSCLQAADLLLPDSELLVLLWRLITKKRIQKVSGIDYLRELLQNGSFRHAKKVWVVPTAAAREKAIAFLRKAELAVDEADFVTLGDDSGQNHSALLQIESRRPEHIIIALRTGYQEQLGVYLRDYLMYRPCIHCVGAALGFLTGAERPIPEFLQRRHLGWLARLAAQPGMILPRLGIACSLAWMVFRYRSELPPLKVRWADV